MRQTERDELRLELDEIVDKWERLPISKDKNAIEPLEGFGWTMKKELFNWFITKMEEREEKAKQDLENNDIEVELDTEQCSEIALMVYEKYLEWLKKPQFAVIPFQEWVKKNLVKSTKLKDKHDN